MCFYVHVHPYMKSVLVNCRNCSFYCTSLVAITLVVVIILYAQLHLAVSASVFVCVYVGV